MMEYRAKPIAVGFAFPEGPRWHAGLFWFSDIHGGQVHALTAEGEAVEDISVPGEPSGLGWLPNGDLLVVSRRERRLYRRYNGALAVHGDLAGVHEIFSNDMVVDRAGRAYVGSVGFDYTRGEACRPSKLAIVRPDGTTDVAADDLMCPNGAVITPDERTLIVGESLAKRLTAFDIDENGRLSRRRVFAELGNFSPDGICLDAEGCIWVAIPNAEGVVRVREGGEITDRVMLDGGARAYACMLGGADRRNLYICCGTTHDGKLAVATRPGRIDMVRVPVAGAGTP